MSYVDAGYAICLAVLALYALSLVLRHRRLERAEALRVESACPGALRGGRAAPGTVPSQHEGSSGP